MTNNEADREKVIKAVETYFDSWIDKHRNMWLDLQAVEQVKHDALKLLKEQPEIVRCKNCKHAYMAGNLCKYCDLYKDDDGFPIELYLEADWFCAGGERKKKEDA